MGVRESWNELGTGAKILVGLVVAGVVLVVGLVLLLILTTVVASFVLGLGGSPDGVAMPQASMAGDYDASSEMLEITHDGGDAIEAAALRIETDDGTIDWNDQDGEVTAGDSTTVEATPGTTVRVVWVGDEESSTLFRQTVQ